MCWNRSLPANKLENKQFMKVEIIIIFGFSLISDFVHSADFNASFDVVVEMNYWKADFSNIYRPVQRSRKTVISTFDN